MATITDFSGVSRAFPLSYKLNVWMESFKQYRLYRQTISELNALSNAELVDLGLHRAGIKAVALEAVYGIK